LSRHAKLSRDERILACLVLVSSTIPFLSTPLLGELCAPFYPIFLHITNPLLNQNRAVPHECFPAASVGARCWRVRQLQAKTGAILPP